ncbi:Non-ribosomal peptide synthetase [Gnomoniopsis sp. IMI 355080]|nr:Non-ribosomal peptide synthetase [Gnomoniopsis sp. IMI 355080]
MDTQSHQQAQQMKDTPFESLPAQALSILNPNPQRIEGPALLHKIVRNASLNGLPAIDYQAPNGVRSVISYHELHTRAEKLASRILAALPETRDGDQLVVPLLLPQSPELYISQLAVLKAGGAFCPLNLDAPPERVRFIFGDVSARVVITSKALQSKVEAPDLDMRVVLVDHDDAEDLQALDFEPALAIRPDMLAYVMYTSGSTGTPKGVGISHDASTQALLAHDRHIPRFSRFLQFAAPTFDVSVFEIFFPLFRGVTLVSCNRNDMLNDLPAVIRALNVDACELTPTVAGSLLRSRDNTPDLRLLLTIGEMLTEPVIREFGGDADRPSILWAMYGPTEATIHCSLQPACKASSSAKNVGFPLATVSAFILQPLSDDGSGELKVLPTGQTGELAVGGHQTAVGYLNRAEQTSRVFIETPYGRLYRTGDKARITQDGTIECFGRISDGQIKLRGQRIELGEIEQAVLRTPGCRGAVAVVVGNIIVAFCEKDDTDEDTVEEVQQICRDWLPEFMVPGDVIFKKAFPRLPSGKVDRKMLKAEHEASPNEETHPTTDFQDEDERRMAQIAMDALGVHLSSSSVLAAAGVDSLGAIKLASRFRQAGFNASAMDILSSRTLAHLRSRIPRKSQSILDTEGMSDPIGFQADIGEISQAASGLGVQVDAIQTVLPCTPMQVSLLAETMSNPTAYCNWIELQVPAMYTVEMITSWVRDLAQCNEALRTGFVVIEGKFRQVVWKELNSSSILAVKNLSRRYQLDEQGLTRPFEVQILAAASRKSTSVLLQLHHAIYDGWSIDLLLSDLNHLARGGLPVKRPSFRLVSNYYNSHDFFKHADAARGYWAENLLGFQPKPMPQLLATQAQDGQVLSAKRTLDVEMSTISKFLSQIDIGLPALFQTSLSWLWGSILGTDDVVIGNVTSGRTVHIDHVEEIMGPCLTTVPLRVRLAQARTIKELLESVHASNREGLIHCTLPLAEIKKAVNVAPGQALYDALFVYQESIMSRSGTPKSADVRQVAHEDYLETKLLVEIEPMEESFQLRVTYHADTFHYGYIQMLLQQFECVLVHMVENVDADISTISGCFFERLQSVYNSPPKTLEGCPDIATQFEIMAARNSKQPAICFSESLGDEQSDLHVTTYGELNTLANKIARLLRSSGAIVNSPVAIIMEKSTMLYAGILGILKAGCAYLPLLPSTPQARIQTILTQAGVGLCLSDELSEDDFPELEGCRFVNLIDENLRDYVGDNLMVTADPSRVANIIYTSGSTGVPKGVCVTQLNVCSNLDVLSRIYPVDENSRMLQACSQAFDVSVFEILFALTRGMCLCAATNDTLFADLEKSIRAMDVTHLSMTPTVASLIDPDNVPKVDFLVTSGEPMTAEVARKWVGKLYQGYGPSETTNICSVKKMRKNDHIRHLGHTFENTSVFLLTPQGMDVVPVGCVGELCFGGDQVVAGYLHLPEVTEEKFVNHPQFGRIYRSGDIGRMLADGSLLIVGRIDDQVKLRGQRIELGEINNVVTASGEVSHCVTMLVNRDDDSSQQLACFYVPESVDSAKCQLLPAGDELTKKKEAIYHVVRTRLPRYMVPSHLIPISSIPMTSSGKVDRSKLRQVFSNLSPQQLAALDANASTETDDDWTSEESKIATLVAATLNVNVRDVGRWTPLTSLGLDSISAISVASGLQKMFSQRISISAILQNASVARLASTLSQKQAGMTADKTELHNLPADVVERIKMKMTAKGHMVESVLPCTPLQEAMLASSVSDASYLNKMLLRLQDDAAAMKSYWSIMFRRHGILRTCFFSTNERDKAVAQCVLARWEPEWLNFDATGSSLEYTIRKHIEAVPSSIDSEMPPISLALITEGTETYLSFLCHHAMYDGVAITRLLKEIEAIACGADLNAPPSHEAFLREMFALPEDTDMFWNRHLEGFKPKMLSRSDRIDTVRDVLTKPLPMSLVDIDSALKSQNVSLLSLLQGAWSTVLRIILDADDVCFGNVVNGRTGTVERVDELVAPCFNTIPARMDFSENQRNNDVLRSFQALNPKMLNYQFTPLRRIQSLHGGRLFDTLLLLQQPPQPLDSGLWIMERDDGEMDFPLVCEVTPHVGRDEVEVKLHFDRSYISTDGTLFIYDTLSQIVSNFLRYPWSHSISKASLPAALSKRLDDLGFINTTNPLDISAPCDDKAEWSETERTIRNVFSIMSNANKDRISRHTTIYQLGLDSINAVQVAAMLRNEGFSTIGAMDVLENPTCAKLASKMANFHSSEDEADLYDLAGFQRTAVSLLQDAIQDLGNVETVLPCTSLQMGMLTEFINSKGKDYLNFISFRVDRRITASALKGAWVALVEAHPILRVGFTPLDHDDTSFAMLQYVCAADEVPVFVHRDAEEFDVSVWRQGTAQAVLDDLRQPPWQVALIDDGVGTDMHLAIHHIIYDAQSLHMLMDDLIKVLRGDILSNGADIGAAVQDIITQTHKCKMDAEAFWKKQVAVINKFPVMTPLREEKRDILVKSLTSSLTFPALEESVKKSGFTIQAVAQAAWSRILSSYLGEQSVVFGTIFSGRNSEATRNSAFPCITTLPVVADCSPANQDLIRTMMQYNTDLQRYQRTPLTDIQRWLGHTNSRLFDTLLVYQKFERGVENQQPWRVLDEEAAVDYPVSVEIEPQGDLVKLRITFFSDIIPTEQAELLLQQFDAVFCRLARSPERNDLDLLGLHPELFSILPAEEAELESDVTLLHEFVEFSARKYPDKTALDFVSGFEDDQPISRSWTYKQLDECGNKVANMLSIHAKTGDIVAVCFDKCPEAHFALLGILKAGCALLALDPGAPASRKEFILKDSGAVTLLTDKIRSVNLEYDVSVPVVVIGEETMASASASSPVLTRALTPEDRSYCLYTSGTTGTPKGCEITHENAVQAMLAFQKLFDGHWDQDSKWLQFASYHFDVSVLEQYWTWSVGITLVAAPRDVILEDLAGTISRLEITHIDLTPSLARLVHPDDVPSLCRGVFITGGEQLKQEILDVWGPKRVIHNFYGPTEATIGVTTYPRVPINGRSSNIGRQFANVGCYVLRPGTQVPVLRGGVGELCVSGKLVGKGYLNRDELTAERFPTLEAFGDRVYRTGDLVRVLHDGCFDFLGRADDQVKLRGQRLEIGEINQCIRDGVGEVADVVTLVIRNEKQQKDLLVAFVVTTQDQKAKELYVLGGDQAIRISQKVQRACRDRLPGYMVPTYVLLLPFVPLSTNNKAEVKELRALFNKLSSEQLVAPTGPSKEALGDVGRKICKVLSAISGVSEGNIKPNTNIFELGVDSITVLRFVRALKREGVKHVSAAVILRNPTIADLANALQTFQNPSTSSSGILEASQTVEACQHRHRGLVCRTLGITLAQVEYVAPCSALQQGMISRSRSEGNEEAYFNTFRYDLAKDVSLAKLKSAWEGLVRNSSVLRTKFVSTMEGYVQVALKDTSLSWAEVVLKDEEDIEALLDRRRKAWIGRNSQNIDQPLELLVLTRAGKRVLVVHIFHAAYDAISFDLMLNDVLRRYNNEEQDEDAPVFLDALLYGPLRNHSFCKPFWTEHLKGISPSLFPEISEQPSVRDISVSRRIPFDGLDKIRKTLGVSQQAIVQAIWSTVLQRYVGAGVTFGVIISGRSIELDNVDKTIGPLFNTIPYHHRAKEQQTWSSSIRQCHEFNIAILEFQHVPLRDVQKWCSGGMSLFDTLFSLQQESLTAKEGDLWTGVESDMNPDYPLAFEATLLPDGALQASIVAQSGVADEEGLEGMLDEFEMMARAVLDDPDGLVSSCFPNGFALDTHEEEITRLPVTQNLLSGNEVSSFEWTSQSETIRKEVSLLADVDELDITPNTSLLELGLDSIDTIKLSARLRRAGIVLSNSELIKGQSIAHLSTILQEKQVAKDGTHDSGYTSDDEEPWAALQSYLAEHGHDLNRVDQVLPPTPLQDAMVSDMINSDFQRYFNHDVLELSPEVDLERLQNAWITVIQNSPILRTVFVEVASPSFDFAYAQLVMKHQPRQFAEFKVQSLVEVPHVLEQARIKALEAQGQSQLLQIAIAKSSQKTYLVLSIAHALYDGLSLGLLHQDIEFAYRGTYSPRQDYTGYLGNILRASGDDGRIFWSDYMSDSRPTLFPSHHDRRGSIVHRAEVRLRTPALELKSFCQRHVISQQAVAQACWAAVLATHCHQLDVTFGVVLSGRETEASETILFPTMNTVPVRAVFHGLVPDFLRYVQDNLTGLSQFRHFPLRKIQTLVKDGQGSLFNTLFILQKSIGSLSGSGAPLMRSVDGSSSVEYPVCVEMEVDGEDVIWRSACDDGYLSSGQTNSLLEELEMVLDFFINSDEKTVLAFCEDGVSICGLPAFQPNSRLSEQAEPNEIVETDEVWSSTEKHIRDVLAEFSGIELGAITKSHNLYHLGLDSISAIKVSSSLRKRGVAVTVRDMTQSASIKEMAAKASQSSSPSTQRPEVADLPRIMNEALKGVELDFGIIHASDVQQTLPATAMQTHMLSVWQNSNGGVFFPEFRYILCGVSNRETIDDAWKILVRQQPVLRSVFVATASKILPFVMVVLRPECTLINPFVEFSVNSQDDGSWLIRLKIHHALYDGVSLPLLMSCLIKILSGGNSQDRKEDDWSMWKQHVAASLNDSMLAKRKFFWQNYIRGDNAKGLEIRNTTATPADQRVNFLRRAAVVDTASLRQLCAEHGIGVQAVFLAAYAKVLMSCSGHKDEGTAVFGVYLANRDTFPTLQYPTLCLVPLRVVITQDFRLLEVAANVQRDLHLISDSANVGVGLWEVKEWTGVVVDSFVNFLSLPEGEEQAASGGVRLSEVGFEEDLATRGESAVVNPSQLRQLEKNTVRSAYPDAIDVEASLKAGGSLDIGVFGSGERLGHHGAQDLVQSIADVLRV